MRKKILIRLGRATATGALLALGIVRHMQSADCGSGHCENGFELKDRLV